MNARAMVILSFGLILPSCHADRHTETGGGPDAMDVASQDPSADPRPEGAPPPDTALDPGGPSDLPRDAEVGPTGCPPGAPIGQECSQAGLRCEYGTECCCGRCYPSIVCECDADRFGCYYTDACLIPGCPDVVDALDLGTPDTGDLGTDAGQVVQCGSFPPAFPDFDESCQNDHDCVVVFHQVNCCGTEVAWGIAASAKDAFDQAEEECRSQYPGCGCPPLPTEAEDGNTGWDVNQFAVRCKSGECFSYVKGAVPRCHDAGDCEPSQICLAPGEPLPCGICWEPEWVCLEDGDCGPSQVCEVVTGACLCQPAMQCVMRCDLSLGSPLPPCEQGEECVDGHCVARACATDTDCPWLFWCDPTHETCSRRTCETDAECAGGRCVKGACHESLGTCSYLPP